MFASLHTVESGMTMTGGEVTLSEGRAETGPVGHLEVTGMKLLRDSLKVSEWLLVIT